MNYEFEEDPKKDNSDWSDAMTLEDYVISFFRARDFSSIHWQALMKLHGREKLEKIYRDYVKRVAEMQLPD